MTVETETQINDNICKKCGSTMSIRRRTRINGEVVTLLMCEVCRHFETYEED